VSMLCLGSGRRVLMLLTRRCRADGGGVPVHEQQQQGEKWRAQTDGKVGNIHMFLVHQRLYATSMMSVCLSVCLCLSVFNVGG